MHSSLVAKNGAFGRIFCLSLIQAEENLLHFSSCWRTFIESSFPTMTFTTCSSMSFNSPRMCVKGVASRLVLHYIDAWGQLGYLKHDYVKKCAARSRCLCIQFLGQAFSFQHRLDPCWFCGYYPASIPSHLNLEFRDGTGLRLGNGIPLVSVISGVEYP